MDNNYGQNTSFDDIRRAAAKKYNKLSLKKVNLILLVLTVVIIGVSMYVNLLSFSLHSPAFRSFLVFLALLWSAPYIIAKVSSRATGKPVEKKFLLNQIFLALAIAIIALSIFANAITHPVFKSDDYRELINMQESTSFKDGVESYENMLIPTVDYALAEKLGDKKLGEDNLGSQFTINDYTMIYSNNEIYWVGALEYTGFFQWVNNNDVGSPGYIKISATDSSKVEIVNAPMQYIDSAYFGQDMSRKMYASNMGRYISSDYSFEIDDNGTPFYVKPVYANRFALVNGLDAVGVILLNAQTGDTNFYEMGSEPDWVDHVVTPNIVLPQLNYYGEYVHGFWNTMFAKKEIVKVTDGYNYIYTNDNFYLYTGMTSIGNDESIVGVVLSDAKTKETTFYPIGGATEYAAQQSAEGVVQDLSYRASQPILINYLGEPTYFMMLKDNEGLVKKYAYVNVREYQKVGIGDSMQQAQIEYNKLLNVASDQDISVTISEIVPVVVDGTTYYYMKFIGDDFGDKIFLAHISVSEKLPFIHANDVIKVTLSQSNVISIK